MTHKELYRLKLNGGISTFQLMQLYPKDLKTVSEVALMDIPEEILKEILLEEKDLQRLLQLKKKLTQDVAI
jgi:hypothetical protein